MKLIVLLFFISCSHVEFINSSKVPVSFIGKPGHKVKYEKSLEANFYLWGTLPEKIVYDFKDVSDEFDLDSIASLEIKKENKLSSYLWPLFSLGFIVPKYYTLKFKAPEGEMF